MQKASNYKNKNTEPLWQIDDTEHPVALQLFGSEPELMADMAEQIEHRNFDILDINMGCPVPKVVNNGEGSALMKNPELAAKIVRAISDRIKKPVTVKFRKGFNDENINAVEICKNDGTKRCKCRCGTRQDKGRILLRNGGLGYNKKSKGSSKNPGYSEWRHIYT